MLKIYIAGPLFSEAEIHFNERLDRFLSGKGFRTFLPQRDGFRLSELLLNGESISEAMKQIFDLDLKELRDSDVVLFIMDGRVPDEGACVEIGYAYAIGKDCIGLKTDPRSIISNLDNPLIVGAIKDRIARNFDEVLVLLEKISK